MMPIASIPDGRGTNANGRLNWAHRGMSEALDRLLLQPARPSRSPNDHEGTIAGQAAPLEPLAKDIVLIRVPAGDCTNPAFRQDCIGTFNHRVTTVIVVPVGQHNNWLLTLTFGSGPTRNSVPTRAEPSSSTRTSGWSSISPGRERGWIVSPSAARECR